MTGGNREWDDEDDRRPRRRWPPPSDPIAERASTPAILMMVMAGFQATIHVLLFSVLSLAALADQPDEETFVGILLGGCLFALALCKDFFVIRGGLAMRSGQNHGRAMLGACLLCVPDVAWIFALIPGIWSISVLNDAQVRRAFAREQDGDEDEDEYGF